MNPLTAAWILIAALLRRISCSPSHNNSEGIVKEGKKCWETQGTYKPRVPQYLSLRPSWDPTPSPASECVPPGTNGRGDTLACGWGGGGPNSDVWRKSLALCLLCVETLRFERGADSREKNACPTLQLKRGVQIQALPDSWFGSDSDSMFPKFYGWKVEKFKIEKVVVKIKILLRSHAGQLKFRNKPHFSHNTLYF